MRLTQLTGHEIIDLGGSKAYGFGLLKKWGYIDSIPEVDEWQSWSSEQKRNWVVKTNAEINRKSEQAHPSDHQKT